MKRYTKTAMFIRCLNEIFEDIDEDVLDNGSD